MPAQRPRRWVEAAALLITMPFVALAADSSLIPYTQTSYAASAQCTVEGNNWILYIGNSAAPYAWDAAQNPDGSEFRRRIPLMHLHTTAPHQTITCQVFGTGIDVLGGLQVPRDFNSSAPNILNVSLDGQVLSNKDAISLFPKEEGWESTFLKLPPTGATPLTDSLHTLRIQTGPAWRGALKMWGMSANTTIPTDGWQPDSSPGSEPTAGNELAFAHDSKVSTMYNWKSGKPEVFDFHLRNVTSPEQAVVVKDNAQAAVTLPKNSSYLECIGYNGPNYGTLYIDIKPAPPGIPNLPIERDTNKPWLAYDTFFEAPLDPTQLYTVTYSAKADKLGAGVYLGSTKVLEHTDNAMNDFTGGEPNPPPGSSSGSSKSNMGAIIGGAVGGGLGGIALLGLLIFCCVRRRRAAKSSKSVDSEESSTDGTLGEGDPMLEKGSNGSLRPPSQGGRPKSGVSNQRQSTLSMMSERDRRKSTQSGRGAARQSALPAHILAGNFSTPEEDSYLQPDGTYSSRTPTARPVSGRGLLDQLAVPDQSGRSRPVSSSSGRGLLDGLAVPQNPRHSRPMSSSSGRGLLDNLAVPLNSRNSRPVSSSSGRGLLDGLAVPPPNRSRPNSSASNRSPRVRNTSVTEPLLGSPPTNMSPVEQTMVALTGQSPKPGATSLPPGAQAAAPAPFSVKAAGPTTSGVPVPFPLAGPSPPLQHDVFYPPQAPYHASERRDSTMSETSFFSLPDTSAEVANPGVSTVSSDDLAGAQARGMDFLQPDSAAAYGTRPPSRQSRQAIPKDGEEVDADDVRPTTPLVDETRFHPGTAM